MTIPSAIILLARSRLALMIGVLVTHVAVTEGSDVQVCSDLFDLDTAVDPASWPIVDLVVCRTVSGLLLFDLPLFSWGEQSSYTTKSLLLIGCTSLGGANDFRR
jgi:hypothetical protein